MMIGWGIPAIIVGCILIFDHQHIIPISKRNPNFQYGNAQAAISLFVLVISFIGKFMITFPETQNTVINNYLSIFSSDCWMSSTPPKI